MLLSHSFTGPKMLLLIGIVFLLSNCEETNSAQNNEDDIGLNDDVPILELWLKNFSGEVKVGAHFRFDEDPRYLEISANEFNANQVLFYSGFGGWNSRSEFDFNSLNTSVNWLVERDIEPHIHMLFGPDFYTPDWLKNGSWNSEELDTLMQELIQNIMDANDNKNKVAVWNVINELFNDNGTYRTDMVWNQMGFEDDLSALEGAENINDQHPIFIRKAFEYCRALTDSKLEYRDYLIENNNPGTGWDKKHKATYQMLLHLLNANVPIDAVGFQGHYDIGQTDWITQNDELLNAVNRFKSLGLEVYLTELDIGTTASWNEDLAQQQQLDYQSIVSEALKADVQRIYTWGVHDGRDATWRTEEHPLLWDEAISKKPAYEGFLEALQAN